MAASGFTVGTSGADAASSARYDHLVHASGTLPIQGSVAWLAQRQWSANSSEYSIYEDRYGMRKSHIRRVVNGRPSDTALPMSWGNLTEAVAGYLFTQTTGLTYRLIGSQPHPSNPHIRGSLDGFGLDGAGNLFVLETKSHFSKEPSRYIGDVGYGKQVVQNVEIADADYAFFNAVRLLPATTTDLSHRVRAHTLEAGFPRSCDFLRYNYAERLPTPIHIIATVVTRSPNVDTAAWEERFGESVWFGNLFDAITGEHETLRFLDVAQLVTARDITLTPIAHTCLVGESAGAWAEEVIRAVIGTTMGPEVGSGVSEDCIGEMHPPMPVETPPAAPPAPLSALIPPSPLGVAFFKVSSHNLQFVPRQREYWERYMRPVAEQYLRDLASAQAGHPIPERSVEAIPHPIGVFPPS